MATRNKEQSSKHHKTHYAKHREEVKKKNAARKTEILKWYKELKATLICSKCPETHAACLQFHHKDPTMKDDAISRCIENGWSKERILKEIAKCIVLCGNCHVKEHAQQSGHGI